MRHVQRRLRHYNTVTMKKTTRRIQIFCWGIAKLGLAMVLIGVFTLAGLYNAYSKELPTREAMENRMPPEATRIYSRDGSLLYEIYGEEKRIRVESEDLSPYLKQATIAIEDHRFYKHYGVDPLGIGRAMVNNFKAGAFVEGGSTLTQQLAKNAYLSSHKTYDRKVRELFIALQLERIYSKDEILTRYLNEVGYGGNVYGAEAAANMYFRKSASELTLAEAAMLAAITKSPTALSPYGSGRDALVERRNLVLDKMAESGFITREEASTGKGEEIKVYAREDKIDAPHFVMFVREELVKQFGEEMVNRGGLEVTTTLDLRKQRMAESAIKSGESNFTRIGASNAAMVAIDPNHGQILAMVGSRDYFDAANDGNVNVAVRSRPPGSAFKPLVYARAFDEGPWAPGSTLFDLETDFSDQWNKYVPKNYDGKFHGPVSAREALARSYNIPAVKMMDLVGKDKVLDTAKHVGITTLNQPERYGLSLVLGGGDVKLLELAGAYGAFANEGFLHLPHAVTKVTRHGEVIYEHESSPRYAFKPETAYQINSILSDNNARSAVFGLRSPLHIPGKTVAAKTGTTQDYRDAWTIGYTQSIVAGVWVGNNDFSPMQMGSAGAMAAAPIWRNFMDQVLADMPDEPFPMPRQIETLTVDAITGAKPTPGTRATRQDIFAPWQNPDKKIQLASYRVFGCDGAVRETRQVPIVQSEKPEDERWEKPVQEWARRNGYSTSRVADRRETCEPEPVQVVESTSEPEQVEVGGTEDPPMVEVLEPAPLATPVPTPKPTPIITPMPTPSPSPQIDDEEDDGDRRRRERRSLQPSEM